MAKKTLRGYVVDHKESGVRYAVSPQNLDDSIHIVVRELKPWESPLHYTPRAKKATTPTPDSSPIEKDPATSTERN